MENKTEETTPQNPVVEEVKEVVETIIETKEDSISQTDLTDLKKKADASSQNFERAKKAEDKVKSLEDELQNNQVLPTVDVVEESELMSEVSDVKQQLNQMKIIKKYPDMEGVWDKFEEFRADPENKGMNMNTAAKAFRVENELNVPRREGLERQTGGDKVQITAGNTMTADQVRDLRINHGEKYRDMLKKGQINIS